MVIIFTTKILYGKQKSYTYLPLSVYFFSSCNIPLYDKDILFVDYKDPNYPYFCTLDFILDFL